MVFLDTNQMYEVHVEGLYLTFTNGSKVFYPESLYNGRVNYVVFEWLVRDLAGLLDGSGSDHKDISGNKYEQKSYEDPELHPKSSDKFRFSPSHTFGANNQGKLMKTLLAEGKYQEALDYLKTCTNGYDSTDFFVFDNTGKFSPSIPFRFFIMAKDTVLEHLDPSDPRYASKQALFGVLKPKVVTLTWDK